jgi:hypothetical protein
MDLRPGLQRWGLGKLYERLRHGLCIAAVRTGQPAGPGSITAADRIGAPRKLGHRASIRRFPCCHRHIIYETDHPMSSNNPMSRTKRYEVLRKATHSHFSPDLQRRIEANPESPCSACRAIASISPARGGVRIRKASRNELYPQNEP